MMARWVWILLAAGIVTFCGPVWAAEKNSPAEKNGEVEKTGAADWTPDRQRLRETFFRLAAVNTASDPDAILTDKIPSTKGQKTLARLLVRELETIGLDKVELTENFSVFGYLESNVDAANDDMVPTILLLAHMDTAANVPADNITPRHHANYAGGDIVLDNGVVIGAASLAGHQGETIITSDGRTLLGVDDKAGIAELLEVLRIYKQNPGIRRPRIIVGFTPDEEIGRNLTFVPDERLTSFRADGVYTLDVGAPNEIIAESFNAYELVVTFTGRDIHTCCAHNKRINALMLAADFLDALPEKAFPENTEGREGFYDPYKLQATVGQARMQLQIDEFDDTVARRRIAYLKQLARLLEARYPGAIVNVDARERFKNMGQYVRHVPYVVDYARAGIARAGLTPEETMIRGGTDGSGLGLRGIPAPNLGIGGGNPHSVREWISVDDMAKSAAVVIHTLSVWLERWPEQARQL